MPDQQPSDAAVIEALLTRINESWQDLRGEALTAALNECFAEDVVMRGPGFAFLGDGRDFAVQSYHDFVTETEIKNYSLEDPVIDVTGDTATAHYQWQMTYLLGAEEYIEQGRDLFVLARRAGQWLVVWRALLPW